MKDVYWTNSYKLVKLRKSTKLPVYLRRGVVTLSWVELPSLFIPWRVISRKQSFISGIKQTSRILPSLDASQTRSLSTLSVSFTTTQCSLPDISFVSFKHPNILYVEVYFVSSWYSQLCFLGRVASKANKCENNDGTLVKLTFNASGNAGISEKNDTMSIKNILSILLHVSKKYSRNDQNLTIKLTTNFSAFGIFCR